MALRIVLKKQFSLFRNLQRLPHQTQFAWSKWLSTSRSLAATGTLYEPDYINVKPPIPLYGPLNVRMRGYDFAVLESFAKYVHTVVSNLGLETTSFPVPARTSTVQSFKPLSTHVLHEYQLSTYERTIQIDDLTSTLAPILFEVLQLNMPAGVQMAIKYPDQAEDEFRYLPNLALKELQAQVEDLGKDKKKK